MRCIIGMAPPPPRSTPGCRPLRQPSAPQFPAPSLRVGSGDVRRAQPPEKPRRLGSSFHSCMGDSSCSQPRSPPPHSLCEGLGAFPNYSNLFPQGRKTLTASPRVLELNEGEGRSSAAVLQIDVADSTVFVEHVLNVLGSDVWR